MQILPSLEVGGVERGVVDLARAMKDLRENMIVVSSGGRLVSDLQKMGVRHYTLPVHKKSLASLRLVSKLIEIIKEEGVDLVHARSRVPGWIAWLACLFTGTPFVTTCHGYYSNHPMSRVMGWGKAVIVISRVIGRHMIDDFGVPPERIRLVHRGIDLSEFKASSAEKEKEDGVYRIINVGRLSPIKGQIEFLKSVHELRKRIPRLEVWLVGSEVKGKTKYTNQIKQTIHHFGLQSCVKLLGTRRDVPDLIAQSDLLVLSTLVPEAFGRVIVEAGAMGVPVISTRVGGVLDIIDHNENGLLVPPGDIKALTDAMYDLLHHKDKAREFAEKLQIKIREQFTLEKMVDQTLRVYREVLWKKKILIIKLGAMGDLILGTPSFRMIRNRFPSAHVSVLVDKKLAPLVSTCPYVNEVIPINRKRLSKLSYMLKIAKRLRKEGYEISVDLQNSKWTHLLAALALIPERYGFRRGKFGFLVNRHDRSYELADAPVKHQFRILSKLGIQNLDEKLELWPEEVADQRIHAQLESRADKESKLIGLVIGASPKWATKRWPLEYYEELSRRLIEKENCHIVLIGSEEDRETVSEFLKDQQERCFDFVGKTSLLDLVSLVKHLDVLVTGDTAPLHIAAATQTKYVTMFGPTDPRRHVPPGNDGIVLNKNLSCQPCYKGECGEKDKLACLTKISVDEVYGAVCKQLESGSKVLV